MPLSQIVRIDNGVARERGILLHGWFEQVGWLEDGPPDDATLRRVARETMPRSVNVAEALRSFHNMLHAPQIAQILQRNFYRARELFARSGGQTWPKFDTLELFRERRIAVRVEDELISGSLDRLVLLKSKGQVVAADIIDFKTDAIGGNAKEIEQAITYYQPQLEAYRSVVARLYHLEPDQVTVRLAFLTPRVAYGI